jgi:hypothetical protein
MRKEARLDFFATPRALPARLGIDCVAYWPDQGEEHPGPDIAAYAWREDPRERMFGICEEVARVRLRRLRMAYNRSDVRLLAFDLAVPIELAVMGVDRLVQELVHCPEAIVRRVMAAR